MHTLIAMSESVYTRRLNGPILWLAVAVALAVAAALVPMLVDSNPVAIVVALAIAGLMVACLAMRTKIMVSDEAVTLSVFGVSHSIDMNAITNAQIGPATGLKEGAGPRFIGNATAYIVGGPTVQIDTRTTTYLASAEHPEEVVADIDARRQK